MPLQGLLASAQNILANTDPIELFWPRKRRRRPSQDTCFCQRCHQQCSVDSFIRFEWAGRAYTYCCDCSALHYFTNLDNCQLLGPNLESAAPNQLLDRRGRTPIGFISEYFRRSALNCCRMDQGAVQLPAVKAPPDDLKELYISNSGPVIAFWKKIRFYNSALAFTSASYTADNRINDGFIPFQIYGQLCHLHGPLRPAEGTTPAYAQLWFYD
ncbi:hypothetical protein BGW36DRAFT_290767 [Talaromyces proteolyticus]|uniref:Uncharacterized protein n=1 Tax=Talaromyces proteolyticus TaxID=1131652 RepID=A0AAD4Q1E6_9EURO|nr:uncharacterized protein BGW36DRAFT_290767 [Talaromyces proteolyticus]KAH8702199.1 hypothetical protein BGW36DRAFT_290767 [Talaromyces proteolyticus]